MEKKDRRPRDLNLEWDEITRDLPSFLHSIDIPIVTVGRDLRIRTVTPPAAGILELRPADVGRPIQEIARSVEIPDLEHLILSVIDTGVAIEREVKDSQGHWYSLRIWPCVTGENKIDRAIVALVDIHNLKCALEEVTASRDYAFSVVETVQPALIILDPQLRVIRANRSFYGGFKCLPEEVENRLFWDLDNGQWNIPKLRKHLEKIAAGDATIQDLEINHEFARIGRVILLVNARRITGPAGHAYSILLTIENITERKSAELQLTHSAFHDALTDLPNRTLLLDRMERSIARANRRKGFLYALLFLDLDGFKTVNDTFGHDVGDQLLVAIARRLERCVRPGDTVGRMGGDEFVVLLDDITGERDATSCADRILSQVNAPFGLNKLVLSVSVSIGITLSSFGYERPEDLLADVDAAMYHAKSLGKGRYAQFDVGSRSRTRDRTQPAEGPHGEISNLRSFAESAGSTSRRQSAKKRVETFPS